MGHRRPRKKATVGDIVICVDEARRKDVDLPLPHKFIGLVLDKSITIYKIQVLDTGRDIYWPMSATYLWKEKR